MHRINYVSCLSTSIGAVEHLQVFKEAVSSQRGLEAGYRRYIYTLRLSYMYYIRDFTGGGGAVVYPPAFEQKKGHFSLSWNMLVLCEGRIVLKGRRCGQDRCILN